MNPKQNILQVLFENCVFEGNFSELARTLGYNSESRSTIERVRKGKSELTEKTLDALCEKLQEEYFINVDDMAVVANSVAYSKDLYHQLRNAYGVNSDWHNTAFTAIVTENFSILPNFDEDIILSLKEMKLQEPNVYYGLLSHFFILCKDIFPYTNKGKKALAGQLQELNEMLHEAFPGDNRSYDSTKRGNEIILANESMTILKLIYHFSSVIRGYVDDSYFESALRENGYLFDVDDDSFWIVPGEKFCENCTLWYFSIIPTKSHKKGAYLAMKLRAKGKSTDSFELIESYNFMFIINEGYNGLSLLQAYDLPSGKIEYTQFCYYGDKRLLELCFDGMPEQTFNLPTKLECINHTAPNTKEEKIWANIIEKLLKNNCGRFIIDAANSAADSNLEYFWDYDVTNVCIDRKNVTVTYEKEIGRKYDEVEKKEKIIVEQKSYAIPINSYSFLKELTPNEFASVVRYKDTGELAIAWNNLGQNIPLKEFVEV